MSFLAKNKNVLILAAIIAIGLVSVWFGVKSVLAVNNPVYLISSESMVPSLNIGDVVAIRNGQGFSFQELQVGEL